MIGSGNKRNFYHVCSIHECFKLCVWEIGYNFMGLHVNLIFAVSERDCDRDITQFDLD